MIEYVNQTRLWQATLAIQREPDLAFAARERLRSTFTKFRERASVIANEIARDLPEFTVHDVTHLDALWEMADLIAGDTVILTPAEAFVLGGSFLIHDLGMGVAAFPGGRGSLRQDPHWNDIITAHLKRSLGYTPSEEERNSPDSEVEIQAVAELLRLRHAQQAEKLMFAEYQEVVTGEAYHLIDDPELRSFYGGVIGLIAHSHWWSIDQVRRAFADLPLLGAPAFLNCPNDWTVDRLKLACLLRTSDAAHLDSRRAPSFLRILRKPGAYADLHWKFQSAISQIQRAGDRLVFTSGHGFSIEDAPAWWIGFELLQLCDRELQQVDSLFQDLGRAYRFGVRSVAGVEEPSRLKRHIPTVDWDPIDVSVRVSNVATLVRNIGGKQLYGRDREVPLRELIQNASDAVRARRLLEKRPVNWGDVVVRIGRDSDGNFLEVEDNGIGMSTAVLTGPFLDFGTSFWGTAMMREELPGLASTSFESTGQYGIGFFSIFMLGDRVSIATRRFDNAPRDTQVLEFKQGLSVRPLLRRAKETEYLKEGGTRIRIWHRDETTYGENLLSALGNWHSLEELCLWLCPTLDVNLFVDDKAVGRKLLIAASDWTTISEVELLKRICVSPDAHLSEDNLTLIGALSNNLRMLRNPSGEIVGRAAINCCGDKIKFFGGTRWHEGGIITVGGFRTSSTGPYTYGIIVGKSTRAARDRAVPIVEDEEFARWATEQSDLVTTICKDHNKIVHCANVLNLFGADTKAIPIALSSRGWVSTQDISSWRHWADEVFLVEGVIADDEDNEYAGIALNDNVLVVSSTHYMGFPIDMEELFDRSSQREIFSIEEDEKRGWWPFNCYRVSGSVVTALADAWSTTVEDILKISEMPVDIGLSVRTVGQRAGKDISKRVRILRKPKQ